MVVVVVVIDWVDFDAVLGELLSPVRVGAVDAFSCLGVLLAVVGGVVLGLLAFGLEDKSFDCGEAGGEEACKACRSVGEINIGLEGADGFVGVDIT